ncbi:transporter substrate-binding domain-containing protein [Bacteriovorax sp. PP10]|uniref:Transporter substrate-binding domain-containing protein n=1 Tax=Bacteriovorax antarcticus TaxID=3088717 RepID=A0ABU5W1C5_9BACT|nr:transporter substrate-binding domain-containing protein [Bacteriovorax sp. PP10]MEA9358433.1 transporter substrate-binding domain-containing protein [Bacteriovorax sp. PP10]
MRIFIIRGLLLFILGEANILNAKELQIETSEIYPFGHIDEKGNNAGLIYEISNRIAENAGFTYKNKIIPFPRTILDLKNGNADFVIRYTNEEMLKVAIQVAPTVGFSTIILSNFGVNYKSLDDLHGKTVGVIRGGVFDDRFFADNLIIKFEVRDYEQMFSMLLAKRIDAAIGIDIGLYSTARKLKISKSLLGTPLYLQKKYFILNYSKKNVDEKTIKILKQTINKMREKGDFERIEKKYRALI